MAVDALYSEFDVFGLGLIYLVKSITNTLFNDKAVKK